MPYIPYTSYVATFFLIISLLSQTSIQGRPVGSDGNSVDYIVVGAGTAGAVVAKKLTDDKKTSVIALDSGSNLTDTPLIKYSKNVVITVPAALLGSSLPLGSGMEWLTPETQQQLNSFIQNSQDLSSMLYETGMTIPQVDANNRELLWAIALPEGGASSINAGAWCRGTNQMYAQWGAIAGPNWNIQQVQKTFKELEHYRGKTNHPEYRGYHGPLEVRQIPHPTMVGNVFSQATINATGLPLVLDYNDPTTPIGISTQLQLTQRGHEGRYRVSSATAFLNHHVMHSDGLGADGRRLQVLFNTNALKVIWNGNTAVGVEYLQDGVIKQAYARRGVIVCAGLRSSPFLMYSGVGPASLLTSLGIPVVYDNPNVGQALADQPHIITAFTSNPKDTPTKQNTIFSQISWLPAPGGDPTSRQVRLATLGVIPGITLMLVDLCQPLSRGSVTINSANPLAPPVVDIGELTNPYDLDLYIAAFSTYVKNVNIAIQAIDPLYKMIFPDPAILDDPVLLTSFIKENIEGNQHYQSHCRMAPLNQGGVVDSYGRVYGVNNLFIADNSIVPQGTDGSPMATAYLIGANIARLLGH